MSSFRERVIWRTEVQPGSPGAPGIRNQPRRQKEQPVRWEERLESEGDLEVMREVLQAGGREGVMRTDAFDRANKVKADKQCGGH